MDVAVLTSRTSLTETGFCDDLQVFEGKKTPSTLSHSGFFEVHAL